MIKIFLNINITPTNFDVYFLFSIIVGVVDGLIT